MRRVVVYPGRIAVEAFELASAGQVLVTGGER
jgi:hypothetical protein